MTKSEISGGKWDYHLHRLSPSILHDFDIRQMQIWGQPKKYLTKGVKVVKDKERPRSYHRLEETKET